MTTEQARAKLILFYGVSDPTSREIALYVLYGEDAPFLQAKEQTQVEKHEPCPICGPFNEHCTEEFDAYVPVSSEGDIMEREAKPGEEWVYHARYCPNCGRKL